MGYIVWPAQLNAITRLASENQRQLESLELLWLPFGIQVVIWIKGSPYQYLVDEDGNVNTC